MTTCKKHSYQYDESKSEVCYFCENERINEMEDIPRRIRIDKMVDAELAIRKAMMEVEELGADILLTDAINLLSQAKDKVSDYVDKK